MNSEEEEEAGDSLTDPIRQQAITSESSCHVWSETLSECVCVWLSWSSMYTASKNHEISLIID